MSNAAMHTCLAYHERAHRASAVHSLLRSHQSDFNCGRGVAASVGRQHESTEGAIFEDMSILVGIAQSLTDLQIHKAIDVR